MKGYLWIISELGPIAKIYFDKEKGEIKPLTLKKKDYERGFLISAYVLRASKDNHRGEFGYVKENIIYHMKGSKIFVLVANMKVANSPYVYGFLKELGKRLYSAIDGVALIHEVEELVRKILFKLPSPLPPVTLNDSDLDLFK